VLGVSSGVHVALRGDLDAVTTAMFATEVMSPLGLAAPTDRDRTGVVFVIPSTGPRITVRVGPNGKWAIKLVPGVYRFVGRSPSFDDGKRDCLAGGPVTVALHTAWVVLLGCMVR
jgi:hypothetical protein